MWTCPKCDRAGSPHRRCKCGYLADEQPTSEAVTDTCPTCGSDKRDINGRAWLRMREGNCPDLWHDQPERSEVTDAVEAAWKRLRCNGNYEGRTHDRETIDAFLDMENGGMPVTAGLTDDTTIGSTATPPDQS